ncbi:MAG: glycosyltransferase family 2 protein [Candidatus Wallbacteria bacterium]|nr:glycosyltransferase family 2 protein [Candidatus Wallbacteria bacterium]
MSEKKVQDKQLVLSIIIPTRERADTLFYTLKTCVDQDYDQFEIIVSDNFSNDNTREVVESFQSPKIRYFNTQARVSMSDNWEFALSQAAGDFITIIGDDDGFIPGAISKAMALLGKTGASALVWDKVEYCWPDHINPEFRNLLKVCLVDAVYYVRSSQKLRKVMNFREGYTRLPCLYNAIIRRECVEKIKKASKNKRFFNSIAPDAHSGIVLSRVIDRYLWSRYPFSVNGASRHSNGTASTNPNLDLKDSPAQKFIQENKIQFDQRLKLAPTVITTVMGEYLQAREFNPGLGFTEPDWNTYIKALVKEARTSQWSLQIMQSAVHTATALNLKCPGSVPKNAAASRKNSLPSGFDEDWLTLRAPAGTINNVEDACRFAGCLLSDSPKFKRSLRIDMLSRFYRQLISLLKQLYRSL